MGFKGRMFNAAALLSLSACATTANHGAASTDADSNAYWRNATVYFLMTDRFANGDSGNDRAVPQPIAPGLLRGFEGGDIRGVTQRIEEGYFNALGVDAIWTTPVITNVRGSVEEGDWGRTYAYHGYWPLDWTSVDPRFGSEADFAQMVTTAHAHNLRVIVDVIINHAGPVTDAGDPRWPDSWVRPSNACTHVTFATATACELSFTCRTSARKATRRLRFQPSSSNAGAPKVGLIARWPSSMLSLHGRDIRGLRATISLNG
ncbi:MAG: hypothetical protein HC774_00050 [Sphingomonadales bacterium]|nr:hypothetical protein [Sphingomonadales bacterium]